MGIIFANIRNFLNVNMVPINWDDTQNEQLYKIMFRPTPRNTSMAQHRVRTIITAIQQHLTIVPLDKNSNTWCLCCNKLYIDMHHTEFRNERYYKNIRKPPTTLQKEVEKAYNKDVVPHLKHAVRVKRKWELGYAYLLPKNKDPSRTRPIVSYYGHFSKVLGERIARALTVMIKTLMQDWNTSELHNGDDLTKILRKVQTSPEHQVTFIKADVKSQFTNLSKERIRQALDFAIAYLAKHHARRKLCFCIRLRKYEKRYDHIGHPYKYKEIGISTKLLRAYIYYELDYPYFQINNNCYVQNNGLPMGGFNSAPLACLDAMVQEYYCRSLRKQSLNLRYRDDILQIYFRRLTTEEIQQQLLILNTIYGPELTVELEATSHSTIQFLEYVITSNLQTHHYNRNILELPGKHVVRYPPHWAQYPRHIFLGTIIGTLIRATRKGSNLQMKLYGVYMAIMEFLQLHYPTKLISTAINFCGLPIPLIYWLRNLLRLHCHLETL